MEDLEPLRLAALYREELLDSDAEDALDELARAAAVVCRVPIALVSLVDRDRHLFKASFGLPAGIEPSPAVTSCVRAVAAGGTLLVVPDARDDHPPLGEPLPGGTVDVGFCAGMPVLDDEGRSIGTLCVIDHVPRNLNDTQRSALRSLALCIETLIRNRRRQRQLARRLTRAYVGTPALLCLTDASQRIIEVSDQWLTFFGETASQTCGRPIKSFMTAHSVTVFEEAESILHQRGSLHDLPLQFVTRALRIVDVLLSATLDTTSVESPAVRIAVFDVTMQIRTQKALEARARLDEMTGIPNRAWIHERLKVEIERAARYRRPLSVILFDVDLFKRFNDTYGHAVGDEALIVLAQTAREQLRGADEVGRIGGEEFLLVLPETALAGTFFVAERLRASVAALDLAARGLPCAMTISLGVAEIVPGESVNAIIARADAAMYEAKRRGRNRVEVWRDGIDLAKGRFIAKGIGQDAGQLPTTLAQAVLLSPSCPARPALRRSPGSGPVMIATEIDLVI